MIATVGDLPLDLYRREHANAVREFLLAKGGKTATARRELNRIKAVFNVGVVEFDLAMVKNPFEKLKIANEAQDADKRELFFTPEELRAVDAACRTKDDAIRYIIALQADTGARLSEIVGLRSDDVVLDHATPHVHIRPHLKLGRTLKTDASEPKAPLVGMALWAAHRAVEANRRQGGKSAGWLFPRYASDGEIKATHAANTINKWLGSVTKTENTSHSFRHAMRDRLRHANVPQDIQDAIGGWGSARSAWAMARGTVWSNSRAISTRWVWLQQPVCPCDGLVRHTWTASRDVPPRRSSLSSPVIAARNKLGGWDERMVGWLSDRGDCVAGGLDNHRRR